MFYKNKYLKRERDPRLHSPMAFLKFYLDLKNRIFSDAFLKGMFKVKKKNKIAILNVVSSFRGGLWWRANCLICNSERRRRRKVWHQQQQQQHEKHYARTDDVMCNIARQESITRRRCCLIGRLPMSEDDDEQRPSTFSLKKNE